jgi:hypothetical protein
LIGVDQKQGVTGADHAEMSNWFAQIDACFDALAPRGFALNIPANDGKTVVAILFETDRVPFVIKNPNGGQIGMDVPCRDNTRTRSANRADLLQILSPLQIMPQIDVLEAMLQPPKLRVFANVEWRFSIILYVIPKSSSPIVIPSHKCEAEATLPGFQEPMVFKPIKFLIPDSDSLNKATQSEAIIQRPGRVILKG